MAEQAAHNRLVVGSNPSGPTQKRTYELYLQDLHIVAIHRF